VKLFARDKYDRDGLVAEAQTALQAFWATPGMEGAGQAAEACRKLTKGELELVRAWVPHSNPGSSTAVKCERAREIITGVIAEK